MFLLATLAELCLSLQNCPFSRRRKQKVSGGQDEDEMGWDHLSLTCYEPDEKKKQNLLSIVGWTTELMLKYREE